MPTDPELRDALAKAPPSPAAHDIQGRRRHYRETYRQVAQTYRTPPDTHSIELHDLHVPGPTAQPAIPVRLYRPTQSSNTPAALYLHGGSFALGDLDTFAHIACLALSAETGAVTVSVGYRLAPEHPYPAAVEDSYAVLKWTAANAARLGLDVHRLAVVGSSAGGTLAAATALMARDHHGPRLAMQLLKFAPLDNQSPVGQAQEIRPMWQQYLGDLGPEVPPYAVPARATDLSELPPAYLLTGELDPFRDETISYATRLLAAGVSVELHVIRGATHSFDELAPNSAIARRTRQEYHRALRAALAAEPR